MISCSAASSGNPILATSSDLASTASLLSSSTHSNRRNNANGKIMRPYWLCLKSPRNRSAIAQESEARFWGVVDILSVALSKDPIVRIKAHGDLHFASHP